MSPKLFDLIKENKHERYIDLYHNDIILKKRKFSIGESLKDNVVVLGNKTASNYLIKPIHKTQNAIDIVNPKYIRPLEKQQLKTIDQKIAQLNRRLNLSARLRPLNYFSELDTFISLHGKYNPVFKYKWPKEEKLIETAKEIEALQVQLEKLKSPFKKLFVEKLEELELRRHLILAYVKQDFENIALYNTKLFGEFDNELLKVAKSKVLDRHEFGIQKNSLGKHLTLSEIEKEIEKYLTTKKIY